MLIDPIVALLAAFVLQVVAAPTVGTILVQGFGVSASIAFGLAACAVVGLILIGALRYRGVVATGYENIFTLAVVVPEFQLCDEVIAHSGLTAVTVAGNVETRVGRDLRKFKDRLTVVLVGLLFVLLAADVALDDVWALGGGGLVVLGAMVCS